MPEQDQKILNQLEGHWQKMAMLLLWKLAGEKMVTITAEDLTKFANESAERGGLTLFTHGHATSIDFQVVDAKGVEALRVLATQTGESFESRKSH